MLFPFQTSILLLSPLIQSCSCWILFRMRALIVLTICVSACLAHGSGGDYGVRSGGNRQVNLIDYPFTVEESRSSSDTGKYRTLNFPQPQQQQQSQPQYQQRQSNNARSQTQYIDIPYIVESSQSSRQQQPQIQKQPQFRQQQPQIRQQQPQIRQQQPQIRQQQPQVSRSFQQPQIRQQPQVRQQPIFQIERSQPVASFDWPSPQPARQVQQQYQQQQQRSFTSGNQGGNARSESRLIDYPFTVEVISSGGSSGGRGPSSGFSNSGRGSQW